MSSQKKRLFQGVESALWTLAKAPEPELVTEAVSPRTPVVRALTLVLAKVYPEPQTVFEIGLELEAAGRPVPTGLWDEHSSIYQNLQNYAAVFKLVNGRRP